ncbi:MAG: flagellar filament capping protein FliD [Firmicutes bacterium]|nr:flagellar filament capping protein FliD [Bacillota bacterium]
MAINGINSMNNWSYYIRYQQSVNNTRLANALSKNPKVSSYLQSVNGASGTNGVSSKPYADSKDFLKTYNSNMTGLMSSANALRTGNKNSVINEISASSSNTDVASVKTNYTLRDTADYALNVSQTAAAQVNSSEFVSGSALAESDMNFSIESSAGKIDVSVVASKENGGQKTNYQMFKEAAESINSQKSGLLAEVDVKDGNVSLKISSAETGSKNTFAINGDEGSASGLKNVSQESRDAVYSITKNGTTKEYTSSSNDINIEYGRMTATLKKAGETTISTGMDNDKVVSAMKDLVSNYNKTLDFLNKNADRGTGVVNQIRNMATAPTAEKSMELIGVSVNKDGTLKIDEAKLAESLKKDPSLTRDIIGGSFGIAQGAFSDAVKGMGANSLSLINNSMNQQYGYNSYDPFSQLSLYRGNRAFTMNNISALGLMFDMFV